MVKMPLMLPMGLNAHAGVLFCMNYAESHDVDGQRGKFQHALKMQVQIISVAGVAFWLSACLPDQASRSHHILGILWLFVTSVQGRMRVEWLVTLASRLCSPPAVGCLVSSPIRA